VALCELIALRACVEAVKARVNEKTDLVKKVIEGYLPCVPSTGRDAADNLGRYCIVCGFLLRAVLQYNKDQQYPGITKIVDRAIRRRQERLESLKADPRAKVEGFVKRENMILRVLARRMDG
jgi:hypothetical protein